MFTLGLLIGIYAYSIFLLGLLHLLYVPVVWIFTFGFIGGSIYCYRKKLEEISKIKRVRERKIGTPSFLLLCILIVQAGVNLIGVLGPELGFDALWYHLTLPKIYLMGHAVSYIPGGLFLYSTMPKLLELLYIGGLSFGSAIFPKLIHFGFGLLTLVVLYQIARRFLSRPMSFLVLVIFYANLVVGWESISAYIDLGRTFFELLSFSALLSWIETKDKKFFYYSALFIGFAITTKLLAVGSLLLFLILIYMVLRRKNIPLLRPFLSYMMITLLIPLPWLVLSFINTGNPVYPFFSSTYPISLPWQLINPRYFVTSFWNLFLYSPDPINPIYLMVLPIFFVYMGKWSYELRLIFFYSIGGFVLWYITPQTGGGRFIIPYLPLLSLMSVLAILSLGKKRIKQFLVIVAIVLALVSIGYRGIANAKFVPVILGKETESHFLAKHLNFSFGDFADTDGYFATHIKSTDTVLLYGFHNEYYVDFPFIDATFVKKGDEFSYIAAQNTALPARFRNWNLVYINPITHVSLYSIGGIPWTY